VSYPSDGDYEFILRDDLLDDYPYLRDDGEFLGRLHDVFDYNLLQNFDDGAETVVDALHDYLMDMYGIDLDIYFDWKDWKDNYGAA
jgi:hypothetical protein